MHSGQPQGSTLQRTFVCILMLRRCNTMMECFHFLGSRQCYCCAEGLQERRILTWQSLPQSRCLPEHSISILERLIWRDSLIQASMSCRLRFSLVTEVEYTFTAIFGQLQTQTRRIQDNPVNFDWFEWETCRRWQRSDSIWPVFSVPYLPLFTMGLEKGEILVE